MARADRERPRGRRAGRSAPRARGARSGRPRDSSEVCGTSHIRPRSRPSGRRTRSTRPSLSTRAAATVTSTGRAAGAALGQLVHEAEGAARGSARAAGRPGRPGLRGRADGRAELHERLVPVAGALAVEQLLGEVVVGRRRAGTRARAARRGGRARGARCRRPPAAAGRGRSRARRSRCRGPTPGTASAASSVLGKTAAVALGDVLGAAVQVAGAVVVAEARPRGEHVLLRLLGEGRERREAREEGLVVGHRRLDRGLLQHHLGDPDAVRVPRAPPGQVAPVALVPGEEGRGGASRSRQPLDVGARGRAASRRCGSSRGRGGRRGRRSVSPLAASAGEHQAGRGAQVGGHHLRAREGRGPGHDRGAAVDAGRCAPMRCSSATCMKRFSKIVSVIVLAPAGLGHEHHVLRLHVGGEAGVGQGGDVRRP